MGSKRTLNVPINELQHYIDIDKVINDDIYFTHYPRQSKKSPDGFLLWESSYIISGHDTQDGLKLTLKSLIMYDEWYHSFKLSYTHDKTQNIIHQLEVMPDDYPSHREGKVQLFGSHTYYLGHTTETRPSGYQNFNWYQWFDYYKSCINLSTTGKVQAPNDGELF